MEEIIGKFGGAAEDVGTLLLTLHLATPVAQLFVPATESIVIPNKVLVQGRDSTSEWAISKAVEAGYVNVNTSDEASAPALTATGAALAKNLVVDADAGGWVVACARRLMKTALTALTKLVMDVPQIPKIPKGEFFSVRLSSLPAADQWALVDGLGLLLMPPNRIASSDESDAAEEVHHAVANVFMTGCFWSLVGPVWACKYAFVLGSRMAPGPDRDEMRSVGAIHALGLRWMDVAHVLVRALLPASHDRLVKLLGELEEVNLWKKRELKVRTRTEADMRNRAWFLSVALMAGVGRGDFEPKGIVSREGGGFRLFRQQPFIDYDHSGGFLSLSPGPVKDAVEFDPVPPLSDAASKAIAKHGLTVSAGSTRAFGGCGVICLWRDAKDDAESMLMVSVEALERFVSGSQPGSSLPLSPELQRRLIEYEVANFGAITMILHYDSVEELFKWVRRRKSRNEVQSTSVSLASKPLGPRISALLTAETVEPLEDIPSPRVNSELLALLSSRQEGEVWVDLLLKLDENVFIYPGHAHWLESARPELVERLVALGKVDPQANGDAQSQELIAAVNEGDLARVTELIDAGANPEGKDPNGWNALFWAIHGHVNLVRYLIEEVHVDVDPEDHTGRTPLSWACAEGSVEIMRILVDNGADANLADDNGHSPMYFALFSGVEEGSDMLLEAGGDLNLEELATAATAQGAMPLLCSAAANNSLGLVRRLLDAGADPNETDGTGWNALAWASGQNIEITRALLEAGIDDIDAQDNAGYTTLSWATYGLVEDARVLLEAGADPNVVDNQGISPLQWAVGYGAGQVVELLLEHGADRHYRSRDGRSVSDYAQGNQAMIALLQDGADEDE